MSLKSQYKSASGDFQVYQYDDAKQMLVDENVPVNLEIRVPVDSYRHHTVNVIPQKDLKHYYVEKIDIIRKKRDVKTVTVSELNKYLSDLYDKKSAYTYSAEFFVPKGDKYDVERVDVYEGVVHNLPKYKITGVDARGKRFSIETSEPHNYNFYEVTNVWRLNSDGTKTKMKDGMTPLNTLDGRKTTAPKAKQNKCPFGLNFKKML